MQPTPFKRLYTLLSQLFVLTFISYFLTTTAYAGPAHEQGQGQGHHHTPTSKQQKSIANLSPEIRGLLKKEMSAIEQGMADIFYAYITGEYKRAAETAQKIEQGFILKQELTQEQKKELHQNLPHGFLKRDKNFHYMAGMLSHAAQKEKSELVSFYYSRMMEACVGCHSRFATERFRHFGSKPKDKAHAHGDEAAAHKHHH